MPRWPQSTRCPSSSAWNCAKARSPTSPTWCSRSHRWSRRRAHSSTGRAEFGRSNRRCPATPRPICGCCTRSPTRSASTSACRMPRPQARSWPGSAGGAVPGLTRPRRLQVRPLQPGNGRGGAGRLADAVGFRAAAGRRALSRRNRTRTRRPAVGDHRGRDRCRPKGIRSPSPRARGEITLPLEITDMDDRVVWLPLNSPGSAVHQQLGVAAGAVVSIGRAEQ